MKIDSELINKLTPEAAERMALLQMLLTSTSPDEAKRIIAERAAQVTQDGRAIMVDITDSQRKEMCSQILTALAGVRYPTPEETYGLNLEWAVSDALRALQVGQKGWRVPHVGEEVILKTRNEGMLEYFKVGERYVVDYLMIYSPPAVGAAPEDWKTNSRYAVNLVTESGVGCLCPLEYVEAI